MIGFKCKVCQAYETQDIGFRDVTLALLCTPRRAAHFANFTEETDQDAGLHAPISDNVRRPEPVRRGAELHRACKKGGM